MVPFHAPNVRCNNPLWTIVNSLQYWNRFSHLPLRCCCCCSWCCCFDHMSGFRQEIGGCDVTVGAIIGAIHQAYVSHRSLPTTVGLTQHRWHRQSARTLTRIQPSQPRRTTIQSANLSLTTPVPVTSVPPVGKNTDWICSANFQTDQPFKFPLHSAYESMSINTKWRV